MAVNGEVYSAGMPTTAMSDPSFQLWPLLPQSVRMSISAELTEIATVIWGRSSPGTYRRVGSAGIVDGFRPRADCQSRGVLLLRVRNKIREPVKRASVGHGHHLWPLRRARGPAYIEAYNRGDRSTFPPDKIDACPFRTSFARNVIQNTLILDALDFAVQRRLSGLRTLLGDWIAAELRPKCLQPGQMLFIRPSHAICAGEPAPSTSSEREWRNRFPQIGRYYKHPRSYRGYHRC